MNKKIVFFGNERLVSGLDHTDAPILLSLIKAGYDVVCIVANDAGTRSRRQKNLEVANVAAANNIPVHLPKNPMDIYDDLAAYDADAAVLVAYGRIVPQKLIDLFPAGIINIHPSLLPKYRGPSPIESAIVNGDDKTGVSIMSLSAKMDAGPVYKQIEIPLNGDESAPELSKTLANLAADELITTLPSILDMSLAPVEQNHDDVTYCKLIAKSDAVLNPATQTAEQAERMVRAYRAFPKTRITLFENHVIILKAHQVPAAQSEMDIRFMHDSYLVIDELVSPTGKTMQADAYLRGYKK